MFKNMYNKLTYKLQRPADRNTAKNSFNIFYSSFKLIVSKFFASINNILINTSFRINYSSLSSLVQNIIQYR